MKRCTKCAIEKDESFFCLVRINTNKYRSKCKKCVDEVNPNKVKFSHTKMKYNITENDYNTLLKQQNSLCKICMQAIKLVIDHCHTTKKVRGLLCHNCNHGIGCFKDNILILQSAITYLKER